MTDSQEVIVARIETRLIAVERDVRDIKTENRELKTENENRRPSWPSIMSSVVATGALVITLIQIL